MPRPMTARPRTGVFSLPSLRLALAAVLLCTALPAFAAEGPAAIATRACDALADRVARHAGGGPILLRSWEADGGAPLDEPALRDAAFTYDNALAVVALTACGRQAEAGRIAEALRLAVERDRHWRDGRVRNAYRTGPLPRDATPLPPGWWDAKKGIWAEDDYLVGTATGNVAWAALALLTRHAQTGDARDLAAARRALDWVIDATGRDGVFQGGFHGHEPNPVRLTWAANEHAVDLAAAFGWLAELTGDPRHRTAAAQATDFVRRMWQPAEGRFLIGLLPDGKPNRGGSGLDSQVWPLLVFPAMAEARAALAYVDRAHAADGGYDFDTDRDGIWIEGTAQAALTFLAAGNAERHRALLAEIGKDWAPSGLLYATRREKLTTGLAIGPDSTTADFHYYRRPHLGATAWAAIAAMRWNPFTGRRIP